MLKNGNILTMEIVEIQKVIAKKHKRKGVIKI